MTRNKVAAVLTPGQKAGRVYKALKAARGYSTVASLSEETGLHANTLRVVVDQYGDKIAQMLGGVRLHWYAASYERSGSGPFGQYSNARGNYSAAAVAVEKVAS